jgi:hypothetical protein
MASALFTIGGLVAGILSIITGVIILVWPRVLAYIIGTYLIIVGLFAVVAVLQ